MVANGNPGASAGRALGRVARAQRFFLPVAGLRGSAGKRIGGGRLDPLHGEARRHVLERHGVDQPLVEGVVGLHVGHRHAQHVVDVAGHAVELHHLGHGGDGLGELGEPGRGMIAGLDRDEHGEAHADRLPARSAPPASGSRRPSPAAGCASSTGFATARRDGRSAPATGWRPPAGAPRSSDRSRPFPGPVLSGRLTVGPAGLKSQLAVVQVGSDCRLDRGAQPRPERGGQGLDVAVDRTGIADEPLVGAVEPGEAPARLADQRARPRGRRPRSSTGRAHRRR